MKANIDIIMV